MASHHHLVEWAWLKYINKLQERYYKGHASWELMWPTIRFGLHFHFSFPWSSEEIALYTHMCPYIWLCLVLLYISEIFRLKNGWKTFRLAKIDGNFLVISRRSYQKPSLKGNDFCRSRSHTDYCGQSNCEWWWTDLNHYTFFYCGTLVFLLAFHYMHQNFDEVDRRRSQEESSYPKWASNS